MGEGNVKWHGLDGPDASTALFGHLDLERIGPTRELEAHGDGPRNTSLLRPGDRYDAPAFLRRCERKLARKRLGTLHPDVREIERDDRERSRRCELQSDAQHSIGWRTNDEKATEIDPSSMHPRSVERCISVEPRTPSVSVFP